MAFKKIVALLLVLLLCCCEYALAKVDVYLGFMDEEVVGVLKTLLREHASTSRPVVVIERTGSEGFNPGDTTLFQSPLPAYGRASAPAAIAVDPRGRAPEGSSLLARIARRLYDIQQHKQFHHRTFADLIEENRVNNKSKLVIQVFYAGIITSLANLV